MRKDICKTFWWWLWKYEWEKGISFLTLSSANAVGCPRLGKNVHALAKIMPSGIASDFDRNAFCHASTWFLGPTAKQWLHVSDIFGSFGSISSAESIYNDVKFIVFWLFHQSGTSILSFFGLKLSAVSQKEESQLPCSAATQLALFINAQTMFWSSDKNEFSK